MQLTESSKKRNWLPGLAILVLFLLASEAGWFSALDRQAYNLGVRFSSGKDAREDVVVVAIDDKSLAKLGSWPWSRDVLAETTQLIGRAGPEVIGFNLPLDGAQDEAALASTAELRGILKRERKLSANIDRALRQTESVLRGDDKLAASFKSTGRIVLAMPYLAAQGPVAKLSPSLPLHLERFSLERVSSNVASRGFGWPRRDFVRALEIYPPLGKFARQVGGIGVTSDLETFHSEPLMVRYGSEVLPSFALMMATRSKGLTTEDIDSRSSIVPTLKGKDLGTDAGFRIYPRYYRGEDGKSAFSIYSLIDILDGTINPQTFTDKIVIVGLTSARFSPRLETPGGEMISPTVASAHTISSLLNNEQFRLPDWAAWVERGLIVTVGLYLMLVLGRLRGNTALFLSLFLGLMILNAHFMLMSMQAMWLPMMSAAVLLLLGHLVLGTRQAVNARLGHIRGELSAVNRQLGMALQAQGHLDQAFEKYRACRIDDSLLGLVYNLGLDYERKRQFNKAVAAFKFIHQQNPEYNDVGERITQNEQAANTVVLAGRDNTGPGPNLVASGNNVQKPKLGRYVIDSEIGRGAMGMVYLGHDDKIGRTVAIKTMLLPDDLEDDMRDEVRSRFFREAEAAGRLDHPHIVSVYDVGDEQDLAYIAMDYLEGNNLTTYCTAKTLLPVAQVFQIISSVAMALDYAHRQHVVHRDIKPGNIIYDQKKRIAKITDFGVACLTDASKTKTGTVLGSPYYMPPEQLAGKKVDGRADLYSLGVTLYQMLCGELPFTGDSIANLMYNITNEQHPDIRRFRSDLPNCVNNLIDKALEKEAADRFQSGKDMAIALKRCQEHIREMAA
jgi:CHASE2 domain-containing sensor protein